MRHRIVNLVIYDEAQEHERPMRHELVRLARHTRDVRQLFVSMSPHCDVVHQRGGVLYVPGLESCIPGILHKTLEALVYCVRNFSFDFIVRSNISTVIDFPRLPLHELTDTLVYASAHMWNKDDRSSAFASGTNIILNRAAVDFMLLHRGRIRHETIDDVAIGALLSNETIPRQLSTEMRWNDESAAAAAAPGAVFRNRSESRYEDVARMRRIVDRIIAARLASRNAPSDVRQIPTGPAGLIALVTVTLVLVFSLLLFTSTTKERRERGG
jgi:hypothetical protein